MAGSRSLGRAQLNVEGGGNRARVLAYGSNLLEARMLNRAPSAVTIAAVRLLGHALRFHKMGRDGSGKADAFFTGRGEDSVWGLVYELSPTDKAALDLSEGLGRDYFERRVSVLAENGQAVEVGLYVASPSMIDSRLGPFSWYKELVVTGARRCGLPADYVASIESVPAHADADSGRVQAASRLLAGPA